MTGPSGPRSGALLLLQTVLLVVVRGVQQPVNPRGWQAAKQAEQRATAAAASWVPPPLTPREALPEALPAASYQQFCSLPPLPECPTQPTAWAELASGIAATFLVGVLAGIVLHRRLQRWWGSRRQLQAAPLSQLLQQAEAVQYPAEDRPHEVAQQRVQVRRLTPAGAECKAALAAASSEWRQAAEAPAVEAAAAGAAAKQGESLAGTPVRQGTATMPAAAVAGPAPGVSVAEAATAAAVQEVLLQQGTSSSGSSAAPAAGAAAAAASSSSTSSSPRSQQQQASAQEPLPLAAAVASGGGSSSSSSVLGGLRAEEQADIREAAQLVLVMCQSMHIEPEQLTQGERLQLIHTTLHAWQAQQARRHAAEMSRLGSKANLLRSEQRDIAVAQVRRQQAKDAYKLSLERTAGFRRMCSDTLTFGLVVMAAAGTYQLLSRGLLASITASCPSMAAALGGSRRWGLWGAWKAGEAAACYLFSTGDALLGMAVLLAAPWLVYRSGLLSDYHTMPVTKLFLGLGVICGLAGYLAVGKLGGSRPVWLAAWEAWVVLHIAFSAAAHRVQRIRLRDNRQSVVDVIDADASSMYEDSDGWLPGLMWVLLGLVLPVLAGTLPFRV